MILSIIIPSFNQADHIRTTLQNVTELKSIAKGKGIDIEILLIDNVSNQDVQNAIAEFESALNVVLIEKDQGQYDAINKGLALLKGEYWTWLNTDDLINTDGFLRLVEILKNNSSIDYIYGSINYIDIEGKLLSTIKAGPLTLNALVNKNPGIFQPGSFFKTSFTKKIGKLKVYRCCFDYEYILRCLKNNAKFYCCDFIVASFRYYQDSKTGKLIPIFIREQLSISADYGRNSLSYLALLSYLRLLKHKFFSAG